MGTPLTIVFLILMYLSPAEVFPDLAPLRLQIWTGGAALVASLASLPHRRYIVGIPQTYLMLGLVWAVCFSRLANRFVGASAAALIDFAPVIVTFYLVVICGKTPRTLRLFANVLVLIAVYLCVHGSLAYFLSPEHSELILRQEEFDIFGNPMPTLRMRAVGFLNDPNDFAQFLLVAIAFLRIRWNRGGGFGRLFTVIVPGAFLILGIALTKSRGGFVGLISLAALLLMERFGRVTAGILTVVLAGVLSALNFTGNRAISFSGGVDRIDIWRNGWGLFKSSPLWGIGFGWFSKNADRMTAHNSFVLCFTELGLLGYFFWLALIVFSYYQLGIICRMPAKTDEHVQVISIAKAVRLGLSVFLVTGWFLSRTYTATFYVLIGMTVGLCSICAQEIGTAPFRPSSLRWWRTLILVQIGSILAIYMTLKFRMFAL